MALFLICLALFLAVVVLCMTLNITLIAALAAGLVLFLWLAVKQGGSAFSILRQCTQEAWETRGLICTLLLLGAMTASWRASGTLGFLVYLGGQFISPSWFLLLTFFMTCIIGYVMGTSFGVSGIMGAVFMSIGAAGGVNPYLTAGAIMSGVYFGDRTSPASSTYLIIQNITGVSTGRMLKLLLKDAAGPMIVCLGLYAILSLKNPLNHLDESMFQSIAGCFNMSLLTLNPVALVLLLPLLQCKIWVALGTSFLTAGFLALWLQGMSAYDFVRCALDGYVCEDAALGSMLDGGGVFGMVEVCIIVLISVMLTPVLKACRLEELLGAAMKKMAQHTGVPSVMTLLVLAANAVFCNPVAALYFGDICGASLYEERENGDDQFCIDLSDANILCGLVPWSISCSVPLAFMGTDVGCLPFAFFLYLVPVSNCLKHMNFRSRYAMKMEGFIRK